MQNQQGFDIAYEETVLTNNAMINDIKKQMQHKISPLLAFLQKQKQHLYAKPTRLLYSI